MKGVYRHVGVKAGSHQKDYLRLVILPMSVLILVLLLVSFITVMFNVDYLISLDSFVFHFALLSQYNVLIDVLIYSAAQLQECKTAARVFNKLAYLLTYSQVYVSPRRGGVAERKQGRKTSRRVSGIFMAKTGFVGT